MPLIRIHERTRRPVPALFLVDQSRPAVPASDTKEMFEEIPNLTRIPFPCRSSEIEIPSFTASEGCGYPSSPSKTRPMSSVADQAAFRTRFFSAHQAGEAGSPCGGKRRKLREALNREIFHGRTASSKVRFSEEELRESRPTIRVAISWTPTSSVLSAKQFAVAKP